MNNWSEEMAQFIIPGEVKVVIGWIGEGWQGDYDPDDPDDQPLLRFDAYDLNRPPDIYGPHSRSFQDTSYCTRLPATIPPEVLKSVCRVIAVSLADESHWKRPCEEWSWVNAEDAHRIHYPQEAQP